MLLLLVFVTAMRQVTETSPISMSAFSPGTAELERTIILSPGTSGDIRDIFGHHSWAGDTGRAWRCCPHLWVQDAPATEDEGFSLECSSAESWPSGSLTCNLTSLILSLVITSSPSPFPSSSLNGACLRKRTSAFAGTGSAVS